SKSITSASSPICRRRGSSPISSARRATGNRSTSWSRRCARAAIRSATSSSIDPIRGNPPDYGCECGKRSLPSTEIVVNGIPASTPANVACEPRPIGRGFWQDVTTPVRFPRFFVTSPAPCPYLAGKTERKVFTELKGPHAESLNDALGRIGFRRRQTVAYRPSCLDCRACVAARVGADEFHPSTQQPRNMRCNGALVVTGCRPWATAEQFELRQRYRSRRLPGGGMAAMDEIDYADMVEHPAVSSFVLEYRE